MAVTLGLDFGTNSVRALLVRCDDGQEIGTSVVEYPHGHQGVILDPRDANLARQHPGDYLVTLEASVRAALQDAVAHHPDFSPAQVIGIGVDTTGSSPLPVDRENQPLALRPGLGDNPNAQCWLWKDRTGYEEAERITALCREHRPAYMAKCGNTYSSEWFWSKVWHCLRVAPEVFDAAHSWVELADWIPAVLGGVTDPLAVRRGVCPAGHKALYADDWGGLPDGEFLGLLDPKLAAWSLDPRRRRPPHRLQPRPHGRAPGGFRAHGRDRVPDHRPADPAPRFRARSPIRRPLLLPRQGARQRVSRWRAIREQCCRANRRLGTSGLVEHMVLVTLDGRIVEGDLRPSSDTPTHRRIFGAFAGVRSVVHTHSRHAVAFTQAGREIPCLGTTHADYFHGPIPVTRALRPAEIEAAYEWETGNVIVERFAALDPLEVPGVLVHQHGPFAWGTSGEKALENARVLELVAELALGALGINPNAAPLSGPLLDRHFRRKHGPESYYGQVSEDSSCNSATSTTKPKSTS
jgi:L-ribulose-5-phosphate 4-epimerase